MIITSNKIRRRSFLHTYSIHAQCFLLFHLMLSICERNMCAKYERKHSFVAMYDQQKSKEKKLTNIQTDWVRFTDESVEIENVIAKIVMQIH